MKKIITLLLLSLFYCAGLLRAQALPRAATPKKIALTFDACMTNGMLKRIETGSDKALYNAAIIEYLHREKIPATIFITGLWAKKYPDVVKELARDTLFEIGNHSYSHRGFTENCYALSALAENEKQTDLQQSQEILTRLTGRRPNLFRFPGGCSNPADELLVKNQGLKTIGWTFASGDAFNSNTDAIIQNVLQKAKPGAIVVFHLSGGRYAPQTAEVIKTVIPELRKRGYRFVKVSEI
jgi:peptidoglycan/xylan/chitin deacetylase (PgdA/CDA1 family)